ncbi:MAG TPA: hypothetical protein PLH15_03960 [Spirochaetota bacterium]|nr:hypothetical protein [Spirochaetota bacterium]HQQ22973.1 hypothetical protein [Spirochaetota bacterium]
MKNKFIYFLIQFSLSAFYALLILLMLYHVKKTGMENEHFGALCFIVAILLFTVFDYFSDLFDSLFEKKIDYKYYIKTVDSLLSIKTIEDFLHEAFPMLVQLTHSSSGAIFFINQENEDFECFRYSAGKIRKEEVFAFDSESPLVKVMNHPDDIIIRRNMARNLTFEKSIVTEMDKIGADVAAPIYYHDIFIGFVSVGGIARNVTSDDCATIKIFTSKAGSIQAHNFLTKEMIKKREFEKEKAIALKVRKSFFPVNEASNSMCEVGLFANARSLLTDLFYDIYKKDDSILFSFYTTGKETYDSLIFMPAVKVLIQTYIRMGYKVKDSVLMAKDILHSKDLIDEKFSICAGLITGDILDYYAENMPNPCKISKNSIEEISGNVKIELGDLVVFVEKEMKNTINEKIMKGHSEISFIRDRRAYIIAENILELANGPYGSRNKLVAVVKCV